MREVDDDAPLESFSRSLRGSGDAMRCATLAFALLELRRAARIGDAPVSARPAALQTFSLQPWSRN